MDVTKEKLLEALRKAIQAEVEGEHFYLMAARSTDDPKGRAVFQRLAKDEVVHADYLRAQHEAIRTTGKVDTSVTLGEPPKLEGPHPIFSERIRDRVTDAHFEMSALSIGAQLELSAVEFYKGEAEQADDPKVADFFNVLASWESMHYRALLDQQNALKGEYWTDGRFSPF
jgi:rubrerythrin